MAAVGKAIGQCGINGCCQGAPWITEEDNLRQSLSFGDNLSGGLDWRPMSAPDVAQRCGTLGAIPLLRDAGDRPLTRNFAPVDDLTEAALPT